MPNWHKSDSSLDVSSSSRAYRKRHVVVAHISVFLSILIAGRAVWNFTNLVSSLRWLSRRSHTDTASEFTKFVICIPVLDEQKVIEGTLDKFLNQNYPASRYDIYVVTTSKEKQASGKQSTAQVVRDYCKRLPKRRADLVHVVNYPAKDGRMSHQINYLAQKLKSELSRHDSYFVIYNADSNVSPNLLSQVNQQIIDSRSRTGKLPSILQQSAVYQLADKPSGAEGAGLHQTLWTLMHEIPRLRRQSAGLESLGDSLGVLSILARSRITHCVGHGLFVQGPHYLEWPFSDDFLNEDLPYGLQACAMRVPVLPIPSLELASTPGKLGPVYRQKSVWFNPFFEYVAFGKELERTGSYRSGFELKYLILQAYIPLVIWLIHSFVLLGALVFSMLAGWTYVALWSVAFILYWTVPALVVKYYRSRLDNAGANSIASIFLGVPYVLTHSVGPLWAVVRWTRAYVRRVSPDKPKTEAA